MNLRHITPDFAVAPQIGPADLADLARLGFTTVICNRPDAEVGAHLQARAMRSAATAAGLAFVDNPVLNGAMTMDMVIGQGAAVAAAPGPVLAYCRSGTRSTIVWALSQAGKLPTDEILTAAARAGYDIGGMRGQIDALAKAA